jgi:putative copper export protein
VIGPSWDALRLFLHVTAATIWAGGQLTLAALVPALRGLGADVPRAAARAFSRIAWPAFGVLIATGVWNVFAERGHVHGSYRVTLIVKLVVVAVSGLTASLHERATSRRALAVFGALTGISALAALFLGILLAG